MVLDLNYSYLGKLMTTNTHTRACMCVFVYYCVLNSLETKTSIAMCTLNSQTLAHAKYKMSLKHLVPKTRKCSKTDGTYQNEVMIFENSNGMIFENNFTLRRYILKY